MPDVGYRDARRLHPIAYLSRSQPVKLALVATRPPCALGAAPILAADLPGLAPELRPLVAHVQVADPLRFDMATQILPTPRSRSWHLALTEAGLIAFVLVAALAAHFGRDTLLLLRDGLGGSLGLVLAGAMAALYALDVYEPPVSGNARELALRLPQALGLVLLLVAVAESWLPGLSIAQQIWLEALAIAGLTVWVYRTAYLFWRHHPALGQPVLVVGEGQLAADLETELMRHIELGLPVSGILSAPSVEDLRALIPLGDRRRLGRRLIAAFPGGWTALDVGLRSLLENAGYRLDDGVEVYQRITGKLPLDSLACSGTEFRAGRLSPWALVFKRAMDCGVAAFLLLLCGPLMLLLAVLIRLDSPGPAIFRQRRVGLGGRLFTLYKFRSMRVNADAGGPARPAGRHDGRCTRCGRWLRRLRLDELPQLWNILRGDMSLVGPRPFVPEQEDECRQAIPFYEQRWSVPPGATGWAQVNRGYCCTLADNAEKLAYDLFYIRNFSPLFDVVILLQTLKVICLGRGGR